MLFEKNPQKNEIFNFFLLLTFYQLLPFILFWFPIHFSNEVKADVYIVGLENVFSLLPVVGLFLRKKELEPL